MKLFRHDIISIPEITLDESNYTHIYHTADGRKFRSVTTMVNKTKSEKDKQNLQNWRDGIGHDVADYILKSSALIGRETHKLNENYLRMEKRNNDFMLLSQAHHHKFLPYLNKIDIIHGIEAKLFSDVMELAGTADCIGMYDGKLSVIDYKTKRSSQRAEWMTDYFLQTACYARMWKELTGQDIEQLVILASSEQNTIQEFVADPRMYYGKLDERLIQFK
jgi:genome maintenance exonuclease 1